MPGLRRRMGFATRATLAALILTAPLLSSASATGTAPVASSTPTTVIQRDSYGISSLGPIHKPCGGRAIAKSSGGVWTCTFDDEFDGSSLDRSNWWPMQTAIHGFRSGDECYVSQNVVVSQGLLRLRATKAAAPFDCDGFQTPYRSAMISSKGLFSQAYGRFEMRAKFPPGIGFQPAFWMLPANPMRADGFYYGEIDVVEAWGNYPNIASPHLHYVYTPGTTIGGAYSYLPGTATSFHTYTVEWTSTRMTFKYDNAVVWSTGWKPYPPKYAPEGSAVPAPFDQPFYLMLELAMGGDSTASNRANATTVFPAAMQIDYVRVWK